MAQNYAFLIERAEECAREAEGALLDNVRDRALRSEAAWRVMANRALKIERSRGVAQPDSSPDTPDTEGEAKAIASGSSHLPS